MRNIKVMELVFTCYILTFLLINKDPIKYNTKYELIVEKIKHKTNLRKIVILKIEKLRNENTKTTITCN